MRRFNGIRSFLGRFLPSPARSAHKMHQEMMFSVNEMTRVIEALNTRVNDLSALLCNIERQNDELLWASVFHDGIIGSEWLVNTSFSPRRMAVGYNCLYILYRVLNTLKPATILELGLGESTRMTAQFAEHFSTRHIVVEHDEDWIDIFLQRTHISSNTQILHMPLYTRSYKEEINNNIYAYDGLKTALGDEKFNLILIDGPFGHSSDTNVAAKRYSRLDILDLLPDALAERFCIIADDVHRVGELAMIDELRQALDSYTIPYSLSIYTGKKDVAVIVSEDCTYLTRL